MFNKLVFNNKKSEETFLRNKKVKGEFLIKQIYDVLLDANNGADVVFDEILSIIKYDKSLRDKLYIFLAAFEESVKADIFRRYDVLNKEKIYKQKNLTQLIRDIYPKKGEKNSNLYYCFSLELGPTIDLIEKKEMFDSEYINKLKKVKSLRNRVMHHSLLVLGVETSYGKTREQLAALEIEVQSLYELLPDQGYKDAFEKAINDKIGRKYMNKICLEVMKNGICCKS